MARRLQSQGKMTGHSILHRAMAISRKLLDFPDIYLTGYLVIDCNFGGAQFQKKRRPFLKQRDFAARDNSKIYKTAQALMVGGGDEDYFGPGTYGQFL
jgi:hypothetical protein